MGVKVGLDDVDGDNDEKAPPGGGNVKVQGPGLKLMDFPVKDSLGP